MNNTLKKMMSTLVVIITLLPALALAAPKITLALKAESDVTVEEGGKMVTKRIEVGKIEPGKTIFYTLNYKNEGDEKATNVELKNKLPENTVYELDSAWGDNAEVQFSVDGGKSFNKPSLLTYESVDASGKKVQKIESPDKYTDIFWLVKEVPAGSSGSTGFTVKVN